MSESGLTRKRSVDAAVLAALRRSIPVVLTVALAAVGMLLFRATDGESSFVEHTAPWILIALAMAASDRLRVHFEAGESAHSFVLYELPLVLGLVLCEPRPLLIATMVLFTAQRFIVGRQRGLKLFFNAALQLFEIATATFVFRALAVPGHPDSARTWVALLVAITLVGAVGSLAVTTVIRAVGGRVTAREMFNQAAINVAAGCLLGTLGLIVATAIYSMPSLVPQLLLVVTVLIAMVGFASGLNERLQKLRILHDFSMSIALTNDTDRTIPDLLSSVGNVMQAGDTALVLLGADCSVTSTAGSMPITLRPGSALWAAVVERRETVACIGPAAEELGARDVLAAPMVRGDRLVGVLFAANRRGEVRTFNDRDTAVFTTIANNTAVALENARLIDELRDEADRREWEATHDSLTGLPNRVLVSREIDEALASLDDSGGLAGLLLLDLNRFKEVNDSLGHHVGDELLCKVGERLRAALSDDIMVGRLGGDEFAIVVPSASSPEQVLGAAHAAIGALRAPVVIDGVTLNVDIAVGASIAPTDGVGRTALMKKADIAMYHAKSQRSSSVSLYSPDQEQSSAKQLALVAALRKSIDEDRIDVVYQPKVELSSGRVVGVEALCRWTHPTEGDISPMKFIPLAERSGLIGPLTTVVLTKALAQAAAWREAGLLLTVSVNLSAQSLKDPALIPSLRATFDQARVPTSAIILEITENELMTDPAAAGRLLADLRAMGVGLSIDDFGTGYSSLAYLSQLPVNEVKIDRSFVRLAAANRRDAAILEAIARLGTSLDMKVVAEGVEDEETLDLLERLGCDIAQGYFVSRPMPPSDFSAWHFSWTRRCEEREFNRLMAGSPSGTRATV